jgi:alpha-galactosidase
MKNKIRRAQAMRYSLSTNKFWGNVIRLFLLGLLFSCCATDCKGLENGLARTPPMGWNSWNRFWCNINETLIREIADAMVANGMKDAGYEYVNIDDCWHGERDAEGYIQADPVRFPSGIAALADYVHSRGLKLGIYSDAGTLTCQSRPGSRGYEQQDADQYAAWGVDYLKYDWCYTSGLNRQQSYTLMRDCLLNTGRPIVYSICCWQFPGEWVVDVGNLWRTTGDIQDNWASMVSLIDINAYLYQYAGPGHWNDPDMLEVGNGGMTDKEYRTHFSMWCIMAAPLIAGNDLRNMSQSTLDILTAPEVIAVDQDPLGVQGRRVHDYGASEVWVKELVQGNCAVALFNRGLQPSNITILFSDLGPGFGDKAGIRDLWSREDLGVFTGSFTAEVPGHGVVLIKVEPNIVRFVDCNKDGRVDSRDLAILAAQWSQTDCGGCSGADITGDSKVDAEDLAIFVETWLMAWTIPPLPAPASIVHPDDRERNVDINDDLIWTAGADAISHDVYFGTTNPPPFIRNQAATTYDPNTMDEGTGYYWRIDEVNEWGKTTGTVWRFTSGWDIPI